MYLNKRWAPIFALALCLPAAALAQQWTEVHWLAEGGPSWGTWMEMHNIWTQMGHYSYGFSDEGGKFGVEWKATAYPNESRVDFHPQGGGAGADCRVTMRMIAKSSDILRIEGPPLGTSVRVIMTVSWHGDIASQNWLLDNGASVRWGGSFGLHAAATWNWSASVWKDWRITDVTWPMPVDMVVGEEYTLSHGAYLDGLSVSSWGSGEVTGKAQQFIRFSMPSGVRLRSNSGWSYGTPASKPAPPALVPW